MITIASGRVRGCEIFSPIIRVHSCESAFRILAEFELGFGGQVIECTPSKITTVTRVLDCVDTTKFEGTKEDMRHLYLLAAHCAMAAGSQKVIDAGTNVVFRQLNFNGNGVSPLHAKLGAGLLFGSSLVTAVLQVLGDFTMPSSSSSLKKPIERAIDAYLMLQVYPREEVLPII